MPPPINLPTPTSNVLGSLEETPQPLETQEVSFQELEEATDRFEKIPAKRKNTQKSGDVENKNNYLTKIEETIERLVDKEKSLSELIGFAKTSGIAKINSPDGAVNMAINFRNKDLIEILQQIETSTEERMPNYDFLLQCFKLLFGVESHTVSDWLQIKTVNSPYGNQLYNLHDLYRDWLAEGERCLYGPQTTHQEAFASLKKQKENMLSQIDRLKQEKETAGQEQLAAKTQKEISDKKIERLAKNSIKNHTRINQESNLYKINAQREEQLEKKVEHCLKTIRELETQLGPLDIQLQKETTALESLKAPIHLHEKKLVLLEVLLGRDVNQDNGNPLRVELIQRGITDILKEAKEQIEQLQAKSKSLFEIQTQLQDALQKYQKSSAWDQIWMKIRINKLVSKAEEKLANA